MHVLVDPRLRASLLAAAILTMVGAAWQVAHPAKAAADVTQTTAVSGGPNTFSQVARPGAPSNYTSPLEACSHGVSYPLSGANPILSEPLTTTFTSNVPLSVKVAFNGNQWYGLTQVIFTNRSSTPINLQCAVLIFRGPPKADQHYYLNDDPTGHPQSDYLEVPRGDGTSFYIVRLGFHDVASAQQTVFPGRTATWQIGAAPAAGLTLEQIRDSVRLTADLNLSNNTTIVQKYGTNRLSN